MERSIISSIPSKNSIIVSKKVTQINVQPSITKCKTIYLEIHIAFNKGNKSNLLKGPDTIFLYIHISPFQEIKSNLLKGFDRSESIKNMIRNDTLLDNSNS